MEGGAACPPKMPNGGRKCIALSWGSAFGTAGIPLIAPHAPKPSAKGGRPPFAVETMLHIHFLQQWSNLSDPAMEEALYDMALFREFVGLDAGEDNLPDENSILRFRHLSGTSE